MANSSGLNERPSRTSARGSVFLYQGSMVGSSLLFPEIRLLRPIEWHPSFERTLAAPPIQLHPASVQTDWRIRQVETRHSLRTAGTESHPSAKHCNGSEACWSSQLLASEHFPPPLPSVSPPPQERNSPWFAEVYETPPSPCSSTSTREVLAASPALGRTEQRSERASRLRLECRRSFSPAKSFEPNPAPAPQACRETREGSPTVVEAAEAAARCCIAILQFPLSSHHWQTASSHRN